MLLVSLRLCSLIKAQISSQQLLVERLQRKSGARLLHMRTKAEPLMEYSWFLLLRSGFNKEENKANQAQISTHQQHQHHIMTDHMVPAAAANGPITDRSDSY